MTQFEVPTLGMILTMFIVMFGPVKILAPYVKMTAGMDKTESRRLALKGTGLAIAGGVVAATFGQRVLDSWGVSKGALYLAMGVVLLIVALRSVLEVYGPREATHDAEALQSPRAAMFPLAFPLILTPYGVAALILILAATSGYVRQLEIFGLFLAVVLFDLVAMEFAHKIIERGGGLLALFMTVMGVLQVALAIQLILDALWVLNILPRS